jgi:hypothetical protein
VTERFRVNPLVTFSWQRVKNEELALMAHDPTSGRDCLLSREDMWILEFLSAGQGRTWSETSIRQEAIERYSAVDSSVESMLSRVGPVVLIPERNYPAHLDAAVGLWERHGWKLALEYFVESMRDLGQGTVPSPKTECQPDRGEIALPTAAPRPPVSIESVLHRRRTCRDFNGRPLALKTLSGMLAHAFSGVPATGDLVCYLTALRVEGVPPGVYRYQAGVHRLHCVRQAQTKNLESELIEMLIGQSYVAGCAAACLLSGPRTLRPGSALRHWLIRAGALAQRLILLGHSCEVESFLSAAIRENVARGLTADEFGGSLVPVHLVAFGYSNLPRQHDA